jgi:RHS repeat-associated protein
VEYTYDDAGRLTQVQDKTAGGSIATGTYTFTYDDMGRLTQTSTDYSFDSAGAYTVQYGYDAASNRTSMTDPQSGTTSYSYDSLNRLTNLQDPSSNSFGFSYDSLSRRTQMTRPNGINTNYSYDNVSHLQSVLHQSGSTTLDGASYTYDNAGNRTSKTDYLNSVTSNYTYDPLYQLTQVTQGSSTTESYTYDAVGNRLSSLGVSSYSYNSSNQLTSDSNASYAYDYNGNLTSKTDSSGTTSYTWDYENRLTQVTLPGSGGTVTFKYDPFGRRVQKSSSSGTVDYLYDGDNLFEEVDNAGNSSALYTHAASLDRPLAEFRSSSTSYYEADALGNVTTLTSSSGTTINTYAYDSFGKLVSSTGALTNPFQFTGRESDIETGLYFYRARYYDSAVGRLLSEDPIGFNGSNDFYVYVLNNPLLWTDPLGLVHCTYEVANHHYHCVSDDGTQTYDTTRVRSGNGNCRDNPECSATRNRGPIPPGRYNMGGMGNTPNPHRVPRVALAPQPGTNTLNRDALEVHQGGPNDSAGCITIDPAEYDRFRRFYQIDNHGDTTVQ